MLSDEWGWILWYFSKFWTYFSRSGALNQTEESSWQAIAGINLNHEISQQMASTQDAFYLVQSHRLEN